MFILGRETGFPCFAFLGDGHFILLEKYHGIFEELPKNDITKSPIAKSPAHCQ
jgi:hypothetical protein